MQENRHNIAPIPEIMRSTSTLDKKALSSIKIQSGDAVNQLPWVHWQAIDWKTRDEQ